MPAKLSAFSGGTPIDSERQNTSIEKLPNGIHTVIGAKGTYLSGADKIVVLADGVVQESGKPDELLAQNGSAARAIN